MRLRWDSTVCGIVKVLYEHTLPVHTANFMAFLGEKSALSGLFHENRKISRKINIFQDYPFKMKKSLLVHFSCFWMSPDIESKTLAIMFIL